MKKSITLIIALAMLLGMSQCKKNVTTTPTPSSLGEAVHITLYVGGDDSRHIVHTDTGAVDYTDGDVIYVGNGGKYIGYLEYDNGAFSGTIYGPSTDDYLHFYFVGGLTPSETPVVGTTTSFSVDLSDQSSQIPTLSYVHTTRKYDGETTTYETMLLNKCGLVKFNLANTDIPTSTDVAVMGMNNAATVHFNGEPFTYSTNGDGTVILNAVSAQERWAVLPVQSEVSSAVAMADGYDHSTTFVVPAVTANMYYNQGVNVPAMAVASNALTFEAKTAGATVSFKLATGVSMEYSTDGSNWTGYTSETGVPLASIGDKVMFRATSAGNTTLFYDYDNLDFSLFTITGGECYIYGNVMSLLYQNFVDKTEFPSGSIFTYALLFNECTAIYNHPDKTIELPATTLADYCYASMFSGCTNLTVAPDLPAETLVESCYNQMFYGCTSLTTAPELPARTLASNCYASMFLECTNLTIAPELPATTLADECYRSMLSCTGITKAPDLPATTLAEYCYCAMFQQCLNLTQAPVLNVGTMLKGCYAVMFSGCTSLTQAPELPATTLAAECYGEMFTGCTNLTTAPDLPASTLVSGCYNKMFAGCTSLNAVKCLAENPQETGCSNWLTGVASIGTFTKAANVTTWPVGASGIPTDWTVVDAK